MHLVDRLHKAACQQIFPNPIHNGPAEELQVLVGKGQKKKKKQVSINGKVRRNLRPASACVPWGMDDPNNVPSWDDILPGSYDGGARAKVLDEEGIERSLLFPSLYLLAGDIEDPAGRDESVFAACLGEIKACLERALPRLI